MDKKSIAFGFLVGVLVTVGVCFFLLNKSRQIPSSIINDTRTATQSKGISMRIRIASIFVDDQGMALKFYTEKLGFMKKDDIPIGDFRWLTVVSPDAPEGMELLLEPNAHKAAKAFQKAIFEDSIPATILFVDDIQKEYERLKQLGVEFTTEPTKTGTVTIAVFDDTCGNLIQLVEQ